MSRRRFRYWGKRAVVDVSPLRDYPAFRALFWGRIASSFGRQILVVATSFQVFDLTSSTLAVGLLGAIQLIPSLGLALIGGALADAMDRRKLLITTQLALGTTSMGLAINSLAETTRVWPIFALIAVNAGISAIDNPTRSAVLPSLVSSQSFPSAVALLQVLNSLSQTIAPAGSGFLIAVAGLPMTYAVSSLAFVGAALFLGRIPSRVPGEVGTPFGLASILEGIRYLKTNRLILATLLLDLNAMVFGMPRALFPAWGTVFLGGDVTTVGLLFAAPGAGAWLAALTSGWVGHVRKRGRAVILSGVIWGLAITAFGFTKSLEPALLFLAIAGAADVISSVFRNAVTQLTLPDHLRGRISSIHSAAVTTGPRLGDFEAGAVAALTSLQFSVISGGLACVGGTWLIHRFIPELDRYSVSTEPP